MKKNLLLFLAVGLFINYSCKEEKVVVDTTIEEEEEEVIDDPSVDYWPLADFGSTSYAAKSNHKNYKQWIDFNQDGKLDYIAISYNEAISSTGINIQYNDGSSNIISDTKISLIDKADIDVFEFGYYTGSDNDISITSFSINDLDGDGDLDILFSLNPTLNDLTTERTLIFYALNTNGIFGSLTALNNIIDEFYYSNVQLYFGSPLDYDGDNISDVLLWKYHFTDSDYGLFLNIYNNKHSITNLNNSLFDDLSSWYDSNLGFGGGLCTTPDYAEAQVELQFDIFELNNKPAILAGGCFESYLYPFDEELRDAMEGVDYFTNGNGSFQTTLYKQNGQHNLFFTTAVSDPTDSWYDYQQYFTTSERNIHLLKDITNYNNEYDFWNFSYPNYFVIEMDKPVFGVMSLDYDKDGKDEIIATQINDNDEYEVNIYDVDLANNSLTFVETIYVFQNIEHVINLHLSFADFDGNGKPDIYFESMKDVLLNY